MNKKHLKVISFIFWFWIVGIGAISCVNEVDPQQKKHSISKSNPFAYKPYKPVPLAYRDTLVGEFKSSAWLKEHWKYPLDPQGNAPSHWSEAEKDLSPEGCKKCHATQYNDWKGSRHAMAMGPGVLGQLVDMQVDAPHLSRTCQKCHAPLYEQHPFLKQGTQNPHAISGLQEQGLVCAACHVRKREVHGPEHLGLNKKTEVNRGFVEHAEFSKPEFCINCHDFTEEGKKLNGKLLQETGQEWRRTEFAKKGVTCQVCHMPGRRHLWKGIHDSAMVRSAMDISFEIKRKQKESSEGSQIVDTSKIYALLKITNVGAGHRLPTYIIPQINLSIEQLDKNDSSILGTQKMGIVGRRTNATMQQESFDTRIMPGESYTLYYEIKLQPNVKSLRAKIEIWPDEGYRLFYQSLLSHPAKTPKGGRSLIETALLKATSSRFEVWSEVKTLF